MEYLNGLMEGNIKEIIKETFDDKFIKELNDEKNMIIQDLEFDE